ncbi:MAG: hypothetical protein ACK4ZM_00800 [bacterium]
MESLELLQILSFQKIALISVFVFTVSTIILIILNIFMAEKVKVNLAKQVKKEKISFSNEGLGSLLDDVQSKQTSSPSIKSKESSASKFTEKSVEKSSDKSENITLSLDEGISLQEKPKKQEKKRESSIFDLKDL